MSAEWQKLEAMAAELAATGEYKVLRRLRRRELFTPPDGSQPYYGVVVDVETTGLDPMRDEVIELGMALFEYYADGRLVRLVNEFRGFREPSAPIPPEITRITGITDDMVRGHSIDPAAVEAFIAPAGLVVAHNAGFDRRFCERLWPGFSHRAWACSLSQIDWAGEGFEGSKLGYLLAGIGLFHTGHRAGDDCLALLEILSRPLPRSGVGAFSRLLDAARKNSIRIWAEGSPYDLKDHLKSRGYRWSDGSDGNPKAWWIEVPEDMCGAEMAYLQNEIYRREVLLPWKRVTAYERFSSRI